MCPAAKHGSPATLHQCLRRGRSLDRITFNIKSRLCRANSRNTCVEVALERFANWGQATAHEFSRARKQGGDTPGRNKLERLFENFRQVDT